MTAEEAIPQFKDYAWGTFDNGFDDAKYNLHIILDDGNVEDEHVAWCVGWSLGNEDTEGARLAEEMLNMSIEDRKRIVLEVSPGMWSADWP